MLKNAPQPAVVTVNAASAQNIVYLGEDRPKADEGGDWIGRYGGKSFILAAMQAPQDIVGGRFLPKRRWAAGKEGFARTSVAWTGNKGDFFYEVLTGDPKEPARHWIPRNELVSEQQRALVNPLEGGRRYSSWDDRGELRPFDGKGPDLIVNLEIPAGLHRLSLYFIDWDFHEGDRSREHRLFIFDGEKDETALLSSGFVSRLGGGIYKVYGVAGPCKLRLRVQKDRSVCSVLSGIFLDDIVLPDIGKVLSPGIRPSAPLQRALLLYNELRSLSLNSPQAFLGAGDSMRSLLKLANEARNSKNPNEKALAEWLRWRCTDSLLVAPWVREEAFEAYLAGRPPRSAAQAKLLLQNRVAQGQLAEAKIMAALWMKLQQSERIAARKWTSAAAQRAAAGGRSPYLSEIRALLELFADRDPDFAARQIELWVASLKADGEEPAVALRAADELAQRARRAAGGERRAHVEFRSVAALYDAVERVYGVESLGEAGSLNRALAIGATPGFDFATSRKALAAQEKHLQRWPDGRYAQQALLAVVDYGCLLGGVSQPNARVHSDKSAEAARKLLARADIPAPALGAEAGGIRPVSTQAASISGVGEKLTQSAQYRIPATAAALSAAWAMANYCTKIGDVPGANEWYGEIVKRAPESELGKQAAALIKKAEA